MTARNEVMIWVASIALLVAAGVASNGPVLRPASSPIPARGATPHAALDTGHVPGAASVVVRNPFRVERAPAATRFSISQPTGPVRLAPPRAPVPTLVLRAIVGPPWRALVEGIPGHSGATLVRSGDRFGDLSIESLRPDGLTVRQADSTWTLTMVRSWR